MNVPFIRKYVSVLLAFALIFTLLGTLSVPRAHAADEYDAMRDKWKEMLTGGTAYNPLDADIASQITALTATAQTNWNTMNKAVGRTYLWSDLTGTTSSSNVTASYNRLKAMALAYATKGSTLENNATLLADIKDALDWMYLNRYNENTTTYMNWWDWEIGAPLALNDTVVLIYDQLTATQITNYMNAVERFQPTITSTGANRVWECSVIAIRGIIVKSSSKLTSSRDGLSSVFNYVTSGDGFYTDGSFIQHNKHPYTGGYGKALLSDISKIIYILDNSTWEVIDTDIQNVYKWVYNSFEPLVYKGAMMDLSRGREISRSNNQDHQVGHNVIQSIIRIAQFAPAADAAAFKRMVKYWIGVDTYRNFFTYAPIQMIVLGKSIVNDGTITSRGELIRHQQYPSMDRAVHLRPGFGFGLSMFSNRIYNYEVTNSENLKGWYTGEGMTYVYNTDLAQYSDDFWATVNPYRLPGTTIDTQTRANASSASSLSTNNWVGGTSILGLYGISGMDLKALGNSLAAKKSWFMLDDEIVSLGAGITSTDNRPIETIIENRKLNSSGDNALTVNGTSKSSTLGWSETMSGTNWAHLAGNVAGADIGYYFPGSGAVKGLRDARTSSWNALNPNEPTTAITRNYMGLWFDHGNNPTNASYSYVTLPGKSSTQVSNYASNPNVTVLENSTSAQAVKENTLNIVGANFWTDALKWVQVSGSNFLSSDKKASVMTKETSTDIEVAISDPTQANTGNITVEINRAITATLSTDPGIVVTQLSPTIKFTVNVSGAKGKTFKAKFSYEEVTTPPPGLLFSDNFEDGVADGWTTSGGTWSVLTDGTKMYDQSGNSAAAYSVAGNSTWTDYALEATVKPINYGISTGVVGIMARLTDTSNKYNFYYSNGTLEISKHVADTKSILASKAYTLSTGVNHTFKAVLVGSTLDFYVDGVKELTATDTSFASGKIGVAMYKAAARFDNVAVASLVTAPPISFNDNFEDSVADGWSTSGGTWSVVTDGTKMYDQSSTSVAAYSWAGDSTWTDYTIEAKVKPISYGLSTAAVGLMGRLTDTSNKYNFYYSDGALEISKHVAGTKTILVSKAYTLSPGTTYVLKAVLTGGTLDFYVNGVKELTATDTSFSSGKIGLATYKAAARFDDIAVQ